MITLLEALKALKEEKEVCPFCGKDPCVCDEKELDEDVLVDVQIKDEPDVDVEEIKDDIEQAIIGEEESGEEEILRTIVRVVDEFEEPEEPEDEEVEEEEKVEEAEEHEEEEIFPNPEKHEFVDNYLGVDIYHCENCGKYSALINGEKVKEDSLDDLKADIQGAKADAELDDDDTLFGE